MKFLRVPEVYSSLKWCFWESITEILLFDYYYIYVCLLLLNERFLVAFFLTTKEKILQFEKMLFSTVYMVFPIYMLAKSLTCSLFEPFHFLRSDRALPRAGGQLRMLQAKGVSQKIQCCSFLTCGKLCVLQREALRIMYLKIKTPA